jgi:hypothetical protein
MGLDTSAYWNWKSHAEFLSWPPEPLLLWCKWPRSKVRVRSGIGLVDGHKPSLTLLEAPPETVWGATTFVVSPNRHDVSLVLWGAESKVLTLRCLE